MDSTNNFSKIKLASRLFKILAVVQASELLFHYQNIYFPIGMRHEGWGWKGLIKLSFFNPNGILNKEYDLPNAVNVYATSSDVIFNFPSFGEWLNLYTVGFFIVDTLKWVIPIYVFWQLSKAMSYKTDFIGFTTDGVKYIRRAAAPILLIPVFEYISKWIFLRYVETQMLPSKYPYPMEYIRIEMGLWFHATFILLGLAEIFRYGMQLKEETDLTV